jgi:hypothetical protein
MVVISPRLLHRSGVFFTAIDFRMEIRAMIF